MNPFNQRIAVSRHEGGFALRVYRKKSQRKKMPRYLIKCGCCDERVEIYHDADTLEINGVIGSIENWREILMPLLEGNKKAKIKRKPLK